MRFSTLRLLLATSPYEMLDETTDVESVVEKEISDKAASIDEVEDELDVDECDRVDLMGSRTLDVRLASGRGAFLWPA